MAFGDTTSDGDRDPPSPHRPLYRSHMLHAEQQRGSQPEGGGAREGKGKGVRDIGLTDRERVNKPEQINIISRRSLHRRIRSYGRGRRDKLPSIHVRRQLVGAVSLAAHMAAAALRRDGASFCANSAEEAETNRYPFSRPTKTEDRPRVSCSAGRLRLLLEGADGEILITPPLLFGT